MNCIFTGKDTNSTEHVFPRWLQKRFQLQNQTLIIPNGTTLKYKHHRVPADALANNRFGVIEERISRGIFDLAEVYLWALKLHIGCIYRDASLKFDIENPSSPFILDVSDFAQEVWMFQQLFDNWSNGGMTDPSPFGSVFIIDSLSPIPRFDFMHCPYHGGRRHRYWHEIYPGISLGSGCRNAGQYSLSLGKLACAAREGTRRNGRVRGQLLFGPPCLGLGNCVRRVSPPATPLNNQDAESDCLGPSFGASASQTASGKRISPSLSEFWA